MNVRARLGRRLRRLVRSVEPGGRSYTDRPLGVSMDDWLLRGPRLH